jgi:regulatory protein NPR1
MVHGVLLLQRRLSDIVDMAYHEDIVPIIHVASTCELSDLLDRCIQKVAISALDNYLEKQIPGDIYSNIEGLRRFSFIDEIDYFIRGPYHENTVRRIHKAMDSDDIDLVGRILQESSLTLDDAFAIHYAAACCTPKMLAELLKLNSADVNLTNNSGYTPLHMACMRLEPGMILSLVEKGASVLKMALDGRDALAICKRLAREKDFSRKLEKGQERSNACLCIDILEKAKEKCFNSDQVSVEDKVFAALWVDNLHMHMSLVYLENRGTTPLLLQIICQFRLCMNIKDGRNYFII